MHLSTLKVYVAAIAVYRTPIAGQSVGKHVLVVKFNPPRPKTVISWDLSIVLRALWGSTFEPLMMADLQPLSLKTALLLALASVK